MLTHGEDVEAHALRSRGWTISAIARHLGRDPKTVRAYINGERVPGVRAKTAPDQLEPFKKYLAARFVDDPHVWASALYDEVRRLGYRLSYPSFARQLRLATNEVGGVVILLDRSIASWDNFDGGHRPRIPLIGAIKPEEDLRHGTNLRTHRSLSPSIRDCSGLLAR